VSERPHAFEDDAQTSACATDEVPEVRAESASRVHDAHISETHANGRNGVAAQHLRAENAISGDECPEAERTEKSLRAERAFVDWNTVAPSKRPLKLGRSMFADLLDGVLRARWLRGDLTVSNVALAERFLGITEKQVREWREGERSMPAGALMALPVELVEELVERLLDLRNGAQPMRRALSMLRRAVDKLENAKMSPADRYEATRTLLDLQVRLASLMSRLVAEAEGKR